MMRSKILYFYIGKILFFFSLEPDVLSTLILTLSTARLLLNKLPVVFPKTFTFNELIIDSCLLSTCLFTYMVHTIQVNMF